MGVGAASKWWGRGFDGLCAVRPLAPQTSLRDGGRGFGGGSGRVIVAPGGGLRFDGLAEELVAVIAEVVGVVGAGRAHGDVGVEKRAALAPVHEEMGWRGVLSAGA